MTEIQLNFNNLSESEALFSLFPASDKYEFTAKKLFALEKFHSSGFLSHLLSLEQAETIIIFGSIVRGDWHKESDIDLFVYGNADDLELGKYWIKLGREIQFFGCRNKKELHEYSPALLKNILKGYTVKGSIPNLEVKVGA